jgi:hypothetical protein
MINFIRRLTGAALLDVATYEDIETDRTVTWQALAIVILSSLAAGIGAKGAEGAAATLTLFASASVVAMLAWAAWAIMTFEIGAHLLPEAETRGDADELLRTLGFAAAPGLLQVFAIFPGAQTPVFTLALVWTLAASVIAVRQSLDYASTWRAVACVLSATLAVTAAVVLGLVMTPVVAELRGPR